MDLEQYVEEIANHIECGEKIYAIKLFREYTGEGLKDSKEAIDRLVLEYNSTMSTHNAAEELRENIEEELTSHVSPLESVNDMEDLRKWIERRNGQFTTDELFDIIDVAFEIGEQKGEEIGYDIGYLEGCE